MHPQQLSHELREERGDDLRRRRWIVGLSAFGTLMGQIVSLYQTGVVKRLPDPPGQQLFDASKVDASNYAYKRFNSPDGPMMMLTYSITTWLAAAGGKDRARDNPILPIAMGAKIVYDAVTTARLAREEWQENRALCEYCQVATLATVASAALAAPEVIRAVRWWLGSR